MRGTSITFIPDAEVHLVTMVTMYYCVEVSSLSYHGIRYINRLYA